MVCEEFARRNGIGANGRELNPLTPLQGYFNASSQNRGGQNSEQVKEPVATKKGSIGHGRAALHDCEDGRGCVARK